MGKWIKDANERSADSPILPIVMTCIPSILLIVAFSEKLYGNAWGILQ